MARKPHFIVTGLILQLASLPTLGAGYEFGRLSYGNLYDPTDNMSLSYSWFNYDISGISPTGLETGNVAKDTHYVQGSINYHFNDQFSANFQFYRSNNIDTQHKKGVFSGSSAYVRTRTWALTGLYQASPYFSVFAGPTLNQTRLIVNFDQAFTGNNGNIRFDTDDDYAWGYTVGGSFHYPKLHLRATLGYQSKVRHDFDNVKETGSLTEILNPGTSEVHSQTSFDLPQNITFDFQTGIAPKTLFLFNAFWRDWKEHEIETKVTSQLYGGPAVTFKRNTINFSTGFAYQFNPSFAGFARYIFGDGAGAEGTVNPLAPANGGNGIQIGGKYNYHDFSFFAVGRYTWLKEGVDLVTDSKYEDNSFYSLTAGVTYRF